MENCFPPASSSLSSSNGLDPRHSVTPYQGEGGSSPGLEESAKSIAILPFDQIRLDSANRHFPIAIQNALAENLGKIAELDDVTHSAGIDFYRDSSQSLVEVADGLNVGYLVSGSVQPIGEKVQVDIELVDPEQESPLWFGQYVLAMEMDEFLVLQSELIQGIAAALEIELSHEFLVQIQEQLTSSLQAYDLYLQALQIDRNSETLIRRIEFLERAVAIDPDFKDAWSLIANSMYGWPGNIDPHYEEIGWKIQNAFSELERLMPKIEVMVMRANFLWHASRDLNGSIEMLHKAQALDPMHPEVNRHLGIRYDALGDLFKAEKFYELADEVTPLANIIPIGLVNNHASQKKWEELESIYTRIFQDERYQFAHRFQSKDHGTWLRRKALSDFLRFGDRSKLEAAFEAIPHDPLGVVYKDQAVIRRDLEQGLRELKADPESSTLFDDHYRLFRLSVRNRDLLLSLLAFRLNWQGDKIKYAYQALGERSKAFNQNPFSEPGEGGLLAICHALVGDEEQAFDAINRARKKALEFTPHYWSASYTEALIAMAYIVLGEHIQAIESLEKAMSLRHEFLHRHLDLWFIYDPLREDPQTKDRFEALLRGEVLLVDSELLGPRSRVTPEKRPGGSLLPSETDKSIAILPFTNLSNRKEDEPLVNGIHSTLLTGVSQLSDLSSIPRTSVMTYRESEKKLTDIARELGVATLLTGDVQRDADQIRINVLLVDALTDTTLWAETYTRNLTAENFFDIQSQITTAIADSLNVVLTRDEQERLAKMPTQNTAALEMFLKGREIYESAIQTLRDEGIALFEKAIGLDPRFAMAYVYLGRAYLSEPVVSQRIKGWREEGLAKAEIPASMALKLDDDLAGAHTLMGRLHREKISLGLEGDWDLAKRSFERALEINPNYAEAYFEYGQLLLGEFEAINEQEAVSQRLGLSWLRKAVELDPRNHELRFSLAGVLEKLGQFDEARQHLETAVRINPEFAKGYRMLGILIFKAFGRYDDAIAAFRKAVAIDPNRFEPRHFLFLCYQMLGDDAKAFQWHKSGTGSGLGWARDKARARASFQAYASLMNGDREKWLKHLREAVQASPHWADQRRWLLNEDLRAGRAALALKLYKTFFPFLFDEEVVFDRERNLPVYGFMSKDNQAHAAMELAEILIRMGNTQRANYLLDQAWDFFRRYSTRMGWHWHYNAGYGIRDAVRYALKGEKGQAMQALREAVDAGFRNRLELESSALDSLRNEPEFIAIMEEVKADWARQLANVRKMDANEELAAIPGAIRMPLWE